MYIYQWREREMYLSTYWVKQARGSIYILETLLVAGDSLIYPYDHYRSTGTKPHMLSGTELMRRTATPVYSHTGRAISMPTFDGEWLVSTETINTVYRELIIFHLGWNCNNISIKRSKIKRFWVKTVTNLKFGKFCNEFIWGEIEGRASFTRNTKNDWILSAIRELGMAWPGTTCRSRDRHLIKCI